MPKCGSQCWLCDYPVRFDTYSGCSHACSYCFAKRNRDIEQILFDEDAASLERFINGKRPKDCEWVDWNIPLHIGGMSDPFQPCEREHGRTYECLKILAKYSYPFIISTKGNLIAEDKYIDVLKDCNVCVQFSAACPEYDKMETGAATFAQRMEAASKLSRVVPRVNIRVQPYIREYCEQIYDSIKVYAEAGAYGATFEGMKFIKQGRNLHHNKPHGTVLIGGDFVYEENALRRDFNRFKAECHRNGLAFWAGENRLRRMGDSLTCCGTDGLAGFQPNKYNLNHLLSGERVEPTAGQLKAGAGAACWHAQSQEAGHSVETRNDSFKDGLLRFYARSKKTAHEVLGVKTRG